MGPTTKRDKESESSSVLRIRKTGAINIKIVSKFEKEANCFEILKLVVVTNSGCVIQQVLLVYYYV